MSDSGSDTIGRAAREALLDRVTRKGATIGERIPAEITVEGVSFPLREFVWETKRTGRVPPERRDEVRSVRATLESERKSRLERLRSDPLTREEAEALADAIVGIDRALVALGNVNETELDDRRKEAYVEDNRRWLSFIDKLTD